MLPSSSKNRTIQDICHSWVRFEREHGSLEQFDIAVQKVTPRLEELQLFRMQQESANVAATANVSETSSRKNAREKRKPSSSLNDEHSPAKRRKNMDRNIKNDNEDHDSPKSSHPAKGNKETVETPGNQSAGSGERQDKLSKKPVTFNDQCTAFVSNLSFQATEGDLRKFFSDVGGIVAIRILKDKFTRKSRGLAYVDFSDDSHLSAALEKNKQSLLGKKLSILKSDPQQGRRNKAAAVEHGNKSSFHAGKGKGQEESTTTSTKGEGEDSIQLKGKNTFFAVPRNVRPLGRSKPPQSSEGADEENPKSNEEFRKMFIKKD